MRASERTLIEVKSMRDLANLISQRNVFEEGAVAALQLASGKPVGESKRIALQSQIAATRTCLLYFLKNSKRPGEREKFLEAFTIRAPWFKLHPKDHLMTVLSAKASSGLTTKEFQEHALIFSATVKVLGAFASSS